MKMLKKFTYLITLISAVLLISACEGDKKEENKETGNQTRQNHTDNSDNTDSDASLIKWEKRLLGTEMRNVTADNIVEHYEIFAEKISEDLDKYGDFTEADFEIVKQIARNMEDLLESFNDQISDSDWERLDKAQIEVNEAIQENFAF